MWIEVYLFDDNAPTVVFKMFDMKTKKNEEDEGKIIN